VDDVIVERGAEKEIEEKEFLEEKKGGKGKEERKKGGRKERGERQQGRHLLKVSSDLKWREVGLFFIFDFSLTFL